MAGLTPRKIDFAEVHDCFTIAEICVTEALGFFKPGRGGVAALEGKTARDGQIPIISFRWLKIKRSPRWCNRYCSNYRSDASTSW